MPLSDIYFGNYSVNMDIPKVNLCKSSIILSLYKNGVNKIKVIVVLYKSNWCFMSNMISYCILYFLREIRSGLHSMKEKGISSIRSVDDVLLDVLDIGVAVTSETDKEKLYDIIVYKTMEITGCYLGVLYLYEENEGLSIIRAVCHNGKLNNDLKNNYINMSEYIQSSEGLKSVINKVVIERKTVNIKSTDECCEYNLDFIRKRDKDWNFSTKSCLFIPLMNNSGAVMGVLNLCNATDYDGNIIPFGDAFEKMIGALCCQAASWVFNIVYVEEIKRLMKSFVKAMATAIDERTPYNGSHTRKVTKYVGIIVDYINECHDAGKTDMYYTETHKENLLLAATLHDIGKMVVPLSIMNKSTKLGHRFRDVLARYDLIEAYLKIDMLEGRMSEEQYEEEYALLCDLREFVEYGNARFGILDDDLSIIDRVKGKVYTKPDGTILQYMSEYEAECMKIERGTLTQEERTVMHSHVEMTEKILSHIHFSKDYEKVPVWAASHHEMLDGSGYSKQLKGDEIEPEARMLAVVDIYDALTSADRPYKKPMSDERAFQELYSMVDKGKLDKVYVDYLKEALEDYRTKNVD